MGIVVTLPSSDTYTKDEIGERRLWLNKVSGVYVLRDKAGACLYVGKTVNLWTRLNNHINGQQDSIRFYKNINTVTLYLTSSQFELEIYETYLINMLMPKFNRDKMFFSDHVEFLSDKLDALEDELHHLGETRAALIHAIRFVGDFAEEEFYDERVVLFEDTANIAELKSVEEKIRRLRAEHGLIRGQLTVAGGVSA
jgi:excinuclease UvrABC nuclease subunit